MNCSTVSGPDFVKPRVKHDLVAVGDGDILEMR